MKSMFEEYRQREQAAKLSTHTLEPLRRFNPICYDDDKDYDYKESTIPLNEINYQIPPSNAITTSPLMLLIEDPEDSLVIRNEELNTIPKKESDEFIKSSVEDLVPILSEAEDTSENNSECILPSYDDFSPIEIPEEKDVTFSNPFFNSNVDFISRYPMRTDVNPLFDEVLENIESKDSYDSNLDEPDLLVTPLSDADKNECFDTGGDDDEINVLDFNHDPSIPTMGVASILEGFTDEPPLEENNDLFDLESRNDEWKKILYDAPIDDLMISSDFEDSHAHGFVHRPLELLSLAYGNPIA
nr:hypothetical protein [Tanacetum cinerariifolium]